VRIWKDCEEAMFRDSRRLLEILTDMAVVVDSLRECEFPVSIKMCSACSQVLVECHCWERM